MTKTSNLVDCLLEGYEPPQKPDCGVTNMLVPVQGQTFQQYAINTFIPYVSSFSGQRVDVVWDVYFRRQLEGEVIVSYECDNVLVSTLGKMLVLINQNC